MASYPFLSSPTILTAPFTIDVPHEYQDLLVQDRLDVSSVLRVRTLAIDETGSLRLHPGAEIVFTDSPIDLLTDPEQLGHGLIVDGRIECVDEGNVNAFEFQAADIDAGASSFLAWGIAQNGWQPGDRLLLTDTRQLMADAKWSEQTEVVTIKDVVNGVVTVESPVRFDHRVLQRYGVVFNPIIGNLSRPITIRSENPAGVRGHVMFRDNASVEIRRVSVQDCGRTTAFQMIDSTDVDANGNVLHVGTNQIGRYSIHCHHLKTPPNIWHCVVERGRKWGIVLHDSHNGMIQDNIVYDVEGAGFMTEDGSESGNRFERNLACKVRGGRGIGRGGIIADEDYAKRRIIDTGLDGSGFWFRGGDNYVYGNYANACRGAGFNYNGYYRAKTISTPSGLKTHVPIRLSESNRVYGSTTTGLWSTWSQSPSSLGKFAPAVFTNYRIWSVSNRGVDAYHEARQKFVSFEIFNDPDESNRNPGNKDYQKEFNIGIDLGRAAYENGGAEVIDGEIKGFNVGIAAPQKLSMDSAKPLVILPSSISGVTLSNRVNILIEPTAHARVLTLAALTFWANSGVTKSTPWLDDYGQWDIYMHFAPNKQKHINVLMPDQVTWDGALLAYNDQRGAVVLGNWPGVPSALVGQTNSQAFAQAGKCFGGQIVDGQIVALVYGQVE